MADNNVCSRVVANDLCFGCGACVLVCPEKALEMTLDGIYVPREVEGRTCSGCGACIDSCPGTGFTGGIESLEDALRKFRGEDCPGAWVAAAKDAQIRTAASSGGVVTAVASYALEKKIVDGVVLARMSSSNPLRAEMFFAATARECSDSIGSKYCPVSLAGVTELMNPNRKVMVVGLPCHIQGARLLRRSIGSEDNTLYLGLVCGGHKIRSEGTEYWLRRLKIAPHSLESIVYRTGNLPGTMHFHLRDGSKITLSHMEFWRRLNYGLLPFSLFRCRGCFDYVNMFADISCGTDWADGSGSAGSTLIVARTPAGRDLFHGVIASRSVEARPVSPDYVQRSYRPYLKKAMANSRVRAEFARKLGKTYLNWPADSAPPDKILNRSAFRLHRRLSRCAKQRWLWPLHPAFNAVKKMTVKAARASAALAHRPEKNKHANH